MAYGGRRKTRLAIAAAGLTLPLVALTATAGIAAPYDTGTTSRVSVRSGGGQETKAPSALSVSATGRYVSFISTDPKLVTNDTNGTQPDVFVHDRVAKTVRLVSVDETGKQTAPPGPESNSVYGVDDTAKMSADGSTVAYVIHDDAGSHQSSTAYLRNLKSTTATPLPAGETFIDILSISKTGRFVVYNRQSRYTAGSDTVLYDAQKPGTYTDIAYLFAEEAPTVVSGASVSADGRYIAYSVEGDNGPVGIYRLDRTTGARISVATGGRNPVMTPDGRFIAYDSMQTFGTPDTNRTYDVFRKDMSTKQILRVSLAGASTQANGASYPQSISDNGDYVAFTSAATNLVTGDTNGRTDVFIRQIAAKLTRRASVTTKGVQPNGGASLPTLSGDGKHVLFLSSATNLVTGDTNGVADAFVRETVAPS